MSRFEPSLMPAFLSDLSSEFSVHFFLVAIYFPLTFLRFGLAFIAAGEALRVAEARIAPAAFFDTPSFLAIEFCTALKPGCFFIKRS